MHAGRHAGSNNALTRVSSLSQEAGGARAQERAALEVYIAGRFRSMITDPTCVRVRLLRQILESRRPLIERVVADHPTVSADDMTAATTTLGPFFERRSDEVPSRSILPGMWHGHRVASR